MADIILTEDEADLIRMALPMGSQERGMLLRRVRRAKVAEARARASLGPQRAVYDGSSYWTPGRASERDYSNERGPQS